MDLADLLAGVGELSVRKRLQRCWLKALLLPVRVACSAMVTFLRSRSAPPIQRRQEGEAPPVLERTRAAAVLPESQLRRWEGVFPLEAQLCHRGHLPPSSGSWRARRSARGFPVGAAAGYTRSGFWKFGTP